jgi:small conductance mechanosensitive channel
MTDLLTRWTEGAFAVLLRLGGILLAAVVLNRLLGAVTQRMVQLAASPTRVALMREQQTRTLAGLLYSAGTAVIVVVAVMTALPEFGVNITPIAAAAGLASLAVGFGAQHLVRDIINGFFIVLEDQFVVGDVVRIGDATGRVEHFTLRRTVLRDAHGALIVIPNGEIRQLANLARDWSQVFVDVALPAGAETERALAALDQVCAELRGDAAWAPALVDGPRVLGIEALTLDGATLRLQVRTAPTRQSDVARELRRRIQARFGAERISLAGVQRVELLNPGRSPAHS